MMKKNFFKVPELNKKNGETVETVSETAHPKAKKN